VAGIATTNLLVSGVDGSTVAITRFDIQHTLDLYINSLSAPKAPAAEDQDFRI
jgi:hypothetical protein